MCIIERDVYVELKSFSWHLTTDISAKVAAKMNRCASFDLKTVAWMIHQRNQGNFRTTKLDVEMLIAPSNLADYWAEVKLKKNLKFRVIERL